MGRAATELPCSCCKLLCNDDMDAAFGGVVAEQHELLELSSFPISCNVESHFE